MIPLISALVILFVNIITTEIIAKRKYNIVITYLAILLYTLTMIGISRVIIPLFFENPNSAIVFMALSWSYLLLFNYIYKNNTKSIIIIMAFSLSHTLFVNGLTYHFFIVMFNNSNSPSFIIAQAIIFLITTPLIIFFIKNTLKKILYSNNFKLQKTVVFLPLFNFFIMFISRFLIDFNSIFTVIIFYITILIMIVLSYYLIYNLIKSSDNINTLNTLVYTDSLTKLRNRLALFHDFQTILVQDNSFNLYYLDLDNLKYINDKYGHINGDTYLIKFSDSLIKTFSNNNKIYRISGDEFIVISKNNALSIKKLKARIKKYFTCQYQFLGVSIGQVSYPAEGSNLDNLLNLADERMYIDKENKEK